MYYKKYAALDILGVLWRYFISKAPPQDLDPNTICKIAKVVSDVIHQSHLFLLHLGFSTTRLLVH